ncbi:RHS repeat-associated core domain-containing protein [Pseudomonas sp. RIT-PI-q]|uniref:RHS repeat-associated core domain-containing protein n=1 Tax=Pseudomonas sp. RIT-PI-q TaxID=1690247 RepID=UPI0007C85C5D|nr:RHS repeat-associated core domain-containing protein [Pseudomonas sp. RIT-PI-q]
MVSIQSTLRCHYRYDPLDRLINQTQPDTPVHQRFYCKSRLATEIQGAIQHSIIQHGDLLLAQGRRQGDLIETTLLATDLQRSVLQTLKANQQGQPIAYSPYGHRRAESGLTSLLGFNGERPDSVTGHYLLGNGYRAFNPVLMRFNSPDSLSPFAKGGLNSYVYCVGDPINLTDPTGHVLEKLYALLFPPTQPIAYSSALVSKTGVTAQQGQRAYSQLNNLKSEITNLTNNTQNQVFDRDYKTAITAANSDSRPVSDLQLRAYKKIRPASRIFDEPKDIETTFEGLAPTGLIERAAITEQASYAPLFQDMINITSYNISEKLTYPHIKHSHPTTAHLYRMRTNSITNQNISELKAEYKRIREQNFQ